MSHNVTRFEMVYVTVNTGLLCLVYYLLRRTFDWYNHILWSSRTVMSVTPSRGLYLYLRTLDIAMDDEIVTDDEASILHVLANALGVSPSSTAECLAIIRGEEKNPFDELEEDYSGHHLGDVTTYQSALIAALDDEVITEDEWSMLEVLRNLIGLQPDQHGMIEEAIRQMADIDTNGTRRIERLNRFNTVCPFN